MITILNYEIREQLLKRFVWYLLFWKLLLLSLSRSKSKVNLNLIALIVQTTLIPFILKSIVIVTQRFHSKGVLMCKIQLDDGNTSKLATVIADNKINQVIFIVHQWNTTDVYNFVVNIPYRRYNVVAHINLRPTTIKKF